MTDWLFDAAASVIKEPSGSGNTLFDIRRDIYSAWKRWVASGVGSSAPEAFLPEGGTPIGQTGIFTGMTAVLTNGWKLMAADHNHQVTLQGNLFSDDGIVSVANPVGDSVIFVSSSVNAQGIATGGSSVSPSALAAAVWAYLLAGSSAIAGSAAEALAASSAGGINQASFDALMAGVPGSTKDEFKATTTALDQSSFDGLMAGVPEATKDQFKATSLDQAAFDALMQDLPESIKAAFRAGTLTEVEFQGWMDRLPTAIKDEFKGVGSAGGLTTEQHSMLRRIWRGLGFSDET